MAISINPVLPVLAAQEAGSVAPDLVLQPGSVVNAQVLKVLSADLVRIAISSLSIDVLSEIPLREGQTLQLAISQTPDGVRLAVVGQGADAAASSADAVTLSSEALVETAVNPPTITAQPRNVLTPLERATVSAAAQRAATGQESLAPLFANLGAVAATGNLPPKLQQAIAQVLAQQTSLDQNLDGGDIKTAFQKSGLFLEASLASGAVPSSGVPDLKAALIVLRQALQSLDTTKAAANPAAPATEAPSSHVTLMPGLAASALPDLDVQEILLPQARVPVANDLLAPGVAGRSALGAALDAGPSAGATLNLIQEALQELGNPARQSAVPKDLRDADVLSHQHAATAISRRASGGAADRVAIDCAGCAAGDNGASSPTGYRRRDRAADAAAGGLAAGPYRYPEPASRHHFAALEFRNSVRHAARHGDDAVRDFA
jgi:hypothetical protein